MGSVREIRSSPTMRLPVRLLAVVVLVAAYAGAAVAVADAKPRKAKPVTVTSGTVNVPIPDAIVGVSSGRAVATITVRRKLRIADLDVGVRITHTDVHDLSLYLVRGEEYVDLRTAAASQVQPDDDFGAGPPACEGAVFTIFDDFPPEDALVTRPPYPGSLFPSGQFAFGLFKGKDLRGTWSLLVLDRVATDTGTINCWKLTAKPLKRPVKGRR
jgi:subtilisin-like proprotein convertase family protein